MITVRLWGGLGNQMFQYALGHRLALKHDTQLVLDLGWFKYRPAGATTARRYELGVFALDQKVTKRAHRPPGDSGLFPWNRAPRLQVIKDTQFRFDERVLGSPDDVWLHGYWQSEMYFADIESQLREAFEFVVQSSERNVHLQRDARHDNSVALHVRRGDYVTDPAISKVHGTVGLDYYRAAVERIAADVESPTFYVFSDDPEWSSDNIAPDHRTIYVSHNVGARSFEDMRLMSQCRHHIVANSSFSWWGAWLGRGQSKIVIAPKDWFAGGSKDASDLVPDSWQRM